MYVASPDWLAVKVHVPAVIIVTVDPDTVQTVEVDEAKVTVRFDVALALIVNAVSP